MERPFIDWPTSNRTPFGFSLSKPSNCRGLRLPALLPTIRTGRVMADDFAEWDPAEPVGVTADHAREVRAGLRPKDRFAILERDHYTCQYCGAKAPDVQLEVDHIKPVSKGGTNDLDNLTTACAECNIGKGARVLEEPEGVEKLRAFLDAYSSDLLPDDAADAVEAFCEGALHGDHELHAHNLCMSLYRLVPFEDFATAIAEAFLRNPRSLAQRCLDIGAAIQRVRTRR